MPTKLFNTIFLMLIFGVYAVEPQAQILKSRPTDQAEIQLLPRYCQMRFSDKYQQVDKQTRRNFDRQFPEIHHHCNGLNWMKRAQSTTNKKHRKFYLKRAINEFDYGLKKWKPNHPLRQEAQMNKMQAEAMLKYRF